MIYLRDYQLEAINKTSALLAKVDRPLIVAPTSSGKSLIIAGICERAVAKGKRVLALCHQAEILSQNENQIKSMAPGIKTAIYCAGLDRKELDGDVVLASRDSFARVEEFGNFDLVIVDEAHLIPPKKDSRYQKIFERVKARWVVGLTGTPWRLDNGKIWGDNAFFQRISYNISLDFLISRGYICPYNFPRIESRLDLSSVGISKTTGDYDERDLTRVSSTEEIVNDALNKWQELARDRKCTIFFCCSIAHANLVVSMLGQRIDPERVGYIDGKTNDKDREELFRRARLGEFKALVNVGVLTTGVDIKPIDCVVMLRATQSAALFVQCIGRGLRVLDGKEDLLVLDMAGNFERFGTLSEPLFKDRVFAEPEEGLGGEVPEDAPKKICPSCAYPQHPATKVCKYCGHIFISHTISPYVGPKSDGLHVVESHRHYFSETNAGEQCVIAEFWIKGRRTPLKEWLLIKRTGGVGNVANAKLKMLASRKITEILVNDIAG